jgi:transcriptional regulator with XRE-family HTH domain
MTPDPKRLRQAREAANLTQDAAHKALSCSLRTVVRWESGDSKPSDTALLAIAAVYGVKWLDLCSVDAPKDRRSVCKKCGQSIAKEVPNANP